MSISGTGRYSSAMTALKMLQQTNPASGMTSTAPAHNSSVSGNGPAIQWSRGSLKTDILAGYGSATQRTEHGDALMQTIIERMEQVSHTDITVTIGAETYSLREAAGKLSDRNIGIIADYANQIATTDQEFQDQVVATMKMAAENAGGSEFNRMAYQAYLDGRMEFVPAETFGVSKHVTQNFAFSKDGQWLSSGGAASADRDIGPSTNEELMRDRVVRQDDGTFRDPETGRYAHFTQIGGRAMVAFFTEPVTP